MTSSYAVIASFRADKRLNGKNIKQAALILRGADTLDDQIETILDIEARGGAQGVFHGMSEDDLKKFLAHPLTMIASDAGPRRFNDAVPHPRGYGNNARVLGRYMRELKVLTLEDAVRKMTAGAVDLGRGERPLAQPSGGGVMLDRRDRLDAAPARAAGRRAEGPEGGLVRVVGRDDHRPVRADERLAADLDERRGEEKRQQEVAQDRASAEEPAFRFPRVDPLATAVRVDAREFIAKRLVVFIQIHVVVHFRLSPVPRTCRDCLKSLMHVSGHA